MLKSNERMGCFINRSYIRIYLSAHSKAKNPAFKKGIL
jgi:hypothetical protein